MAGPGTHPLMNLTVANGETLCWGRRTYVMGIINVSPDSFSGDGLGSDIHAIVEQAQRFQEEGADFLAALKQDPDCKVPEADLEAACDMGYHTKNVDAIFARVFGTEQASVERLAEKRQVS